jgi:hypothetical protein
VIACFLPGTGWPDLRVVSSSEGKLVLDRVLRGWNDGLSDRLNRYRLQRKPVAHGARCAYN